jgi:hypothetical protein
MESLLLAYSKRNSDEEQKKLSQIRIDPMRTDSIIISSKRSSPVE